MFKNMELYSMIEIILIFLAGVFLGESESIIKNRQTWLGFNWWIANNWQYKNKVVEWLMRYPFSFAKDGEHLCKSISIVLLGYVATMGYDNLLYYYILFGIGFNLSFHKDKLL